MTHSRTIAFKFISPTNTKPSRVGLYDPWKNERVYLSLSGSDMVTTVRDYLLTKELTILSFGYTDVSTDKGVMFLDRFDRSIK